MFIIRSVLRNEAGEGDGGTSQASEPQDKGGSEKEPKRVPKEVVEERARKKGVSLIADKREARHRAAEEFAKLKASEKAKAAESKAKPEADDSDDKPAAKASKPVAKEAPEPKEAREKQSDKPVTKRASDGKFSNAETIEDAPTAAAEKAGKAIAAEGDKVPEQRDNETDKQYEARLVRMAQDLRRSEAQTKAEREARGQAERTASEASAKAEKLEKILSRGKNIESVVEFLHEDLGLTLEDIVKGINEGKTRAPGARAKLDPETQARIDALEAENKRNAEFVKRREEEERQAVERQQFEGHVKHAEAYIAENEDAYPLVKLLKWGAHTIVKNALKNGGDMSAPAAQLQKSIEDDFAPIFGNEKAMARLAKLAPKEAKAVIAKAFGLHLSAPAKPEQAEAEPEERSAPRRAPAVAKASTEEPAPYRIDRKTMTARERARIATLAFEEHRRKQQASR